MKTDFLKEYLYILNEGKDVKVREDTFASIKVIDFNADLLKEVCEDSSIAAPIENFSLSRAVSIEELKEAIKEKIFEKLKAAKMKDSDEEEEEEEEEKENKENKEENKEGNNKENKEENKEGNNEDSSKKEEGNS